MRTDPKVKTASAGEDPVIDTFLALIAQDIRQNPGHIRALDATLSLKLSALVDGVELDLDAAL